MVVLWFRNCTKICLKPLSWPTEIYRKGLSPVRLVAIKILSQRAQDNPLFLKTSRRRGSRALLVGDLVPSCSFRNSLCMRWVGNTIQAFSEAQNRTFRLLMQHSKWKCLSSTDNHMAFKTSGWSSSSAPYTTSKL